MKKENKTLNKSITTDSILSSMDHARYIDKQISESQKWTIKFADFLTESFGTVLFLNVNAIIFFVWIVINLGLFKSTNVFDPFPFGLLTMIVSLEAIFLSIIVLISQNRATKIADERQEMDFLINVRAEEEITRMINMLDEVHDHLGLKKEDDLELAGMKLKTNITELHEGMLDSNKK
ncbi:MAG: DUF1003 domain-containing protein [bacterium]|nr:DUF1003 domain-containing protein [bacterium]